MSKEKFYKRLIGWFAFMLVFLALFGEKASCQETPFYTRGSWQTAVGCSALLGVMVSSIDAHFSLNVCLSFSKSRAYVV
jgi:hypothetical protein